MVNRQLSSATRGPGCATPCSGEIHVWRATRCVGPDVYRGLEGTLSAEEQECAKRHAHRDDRERFVLTRCMVRDILGGCLKTNPGELRFVLNACGKPALMNTGQSWLRFNVSHSGDLCLLVVAVHIDVGIDVELIRDVDVALLASRALPGVGRQPLVGEAEECRRMFFARWTRQEACLKAHGSGLSGLNRRAQWEGRCSVVDLSLEDGYAAAVAWVGSPSRVVVRAWSAADRSVRSDGDSLKGAVHDCLPEHLSPRLSA